MLGSGTRFMDEGRCLYKGPGMENGGSDKSSSHKMLANSVKEIVVNAQLVFQIQFVLIRNAMGGYM